MAARMTVRRLNHSYAKDELSMNRLRAITVIALIPLVLFTVPRAAHPAWAQTAAVDVQSASQLQLPDSAFPSDYTSAGSLAMAAADADNTDFSFFHVRSYSALGMRGGWSQVGHAGTFREDNPFPPLVTVAYIDIRLAYMGTYYADEVAARNAFADITTKPKLTTWQLCTQGEQCLQTGYSVNVLGVQTLYGRVRVIQQGNVLVEILSDVLTDNFPLDPATNSKTISNIDAVTQGAVQVLSTVSPPSTPTSTPVPATSTPVNTPTPLPTFTPPPLPTRPPTVTPIPVDFTLLSARTEVFGAHADTKLKRAPLRQVPLGTIVYSSLYVEVRSAPDGASAQADVRITLHGKTVFHRTMQTHLHLTPGAPDVFRDHISFRPAHTGSYRETWQVTIGGQSEQKSATLRVT
ncbi:MAG TPA: hypothetical protein VIO57_10765 [Chloroflexota bacterium]